MKKIRQFHTYLGTFFAPAIFFFAFTGALQTLGLHESERGGTYKPPSWIVTLAELHKDQRLAKPHKKHRLEPSSADTAGALPAMPDARDDDHDDHDAAHEHEEHDHDNHGNESSSWPLKCFVLFLAFGLMGTVLLGIYMAFQNRYNRRTTSLVLLAGVILPLLLLYL